jgi:hypothetical protein
MTTNETELELQKATGVKPKGKDRSKYLVNLHAGAQALPDEGWANLSEAAQTWVNNATKAFDASQAPEDFEQPADETVTETSGGEPVTTKPKKTAKPKAEKKAAAPKIHALTDPEKGKRKAKTVKPAKEPKAAKVAKPKAERKTNGAIGFTAPWGKVLARIAKNGEKGATNEQIAEYCEANGVKPLFARFIHAGYLKRAQRGLYIGTKALDTALARE